MTNYKGIVRARIVDARFATSGKISSINHYLGDSIKKWGLIATLDRKILQTQLDKELADYKKVRADFDELDVKSPNPLQPTLDVSVKNVELAKAMLDQCDLFSPVDGIIIDDSNIVPGLNVTPASASIKIIDINSFYIEVEVEEKDIKKFNEPVEAKVKIEAIDLIQKVKTSKVLFNGKKFVVKIPISGVDLLPGLIANVQIK